MSKALWQKIPRWFLACWVILSLHVCPSIAGALEQTWATIDTEDGLPSNSISAIFFDKDGNLWIGTDKGLALFSKTDQQGIVTSRPWIRTFTTRDGLADDHVTSIAQDREDHLWFGTLDSGASRYDGKTFRAFTSKNGLADNHVTTIAQDREGRLWFGTWRGASLYDENTFRNFTTKDGLALDHVTAIAQDREGHLWFGTQGGGASRYDGQTFRTLTPKYGLARDFVHAIAQDREGHLWLGSGGGASQYDGKTFRNFTTEDGLAQNDVTAIAQDREGRLWFGTDGRGVSRYDGRTFHNFTTRDGLAHDFITAIAQDREGHVWFGTRDGGVSRYDEPLRTFTTKDGLANEHVRTIAQDREGHLWFGTHGGGASRYDGKTFCTFTTNNGLAGNIVFAITQDREGGLWFGTWGGGVSRYDGHTFHTFTTKDGLASMQVAAITQDRQGRIWFGTILGLAYYFEGRFHSFRALATNHVQAIAQDREGRLWFGWDMTRGVSRLDGRTLRTFTRRDGLAGYGVTAIVQDREGRIWFGTAGGVSRYDGQKFRNLEREDGLAHNSVSAITQDRDGVLWFGTFGGLSRYDGQTFRNFTTTEGLADNHVTAIAQDRDGRLWLGTDGGVSVYEETEVLGSLSRLVLALTFAPRQISYGPTIREVLWSYRLDDRPAWSEPSRGSFFVRDYWRLGSGKHVLGIRAWDGKANPPRTTVFPFEVSGSERSIAIAAYLLLLGAPMGAGLYWIGKKQSARRAVQRRFNPYRAGLPVGPDLFTGREDLLKEVTGSLAAHCLLLTGERRIGKTSFLHALQRRLKDLDDARSRWVPVYVSLESVPENQFFAILAQRLIETVGAKLSPNVKLRYAPDSPPASPPYGIFEFTCDLRAILDALDVRGKKPVKLVFLLDEIDVLNSFRPWTKYELRALFCGSPDLSGRIRAVMTGFNLDLTEHEDRSPPFNFLLPLTMTPLTPEEARRLIVTPVRRFYEYEPDVVQRLIGLSAGHALTIQLLCWRLIEHVLDTKRRRVTQADMNAVEERALEDVRRIIESDSSHAGLSTSPPETLERITELERELAPLRTPLGQAAQASPPPPEGSQCPFPEGGVQRSP
ncbi:MAG: two-component regulator propeller domain-containing protein [Isosphaerales bacterium]